MTQKNGLNLLEGNLVKTIVKLGYPLALAAVAQTLYNLADTFWLGKLGRDALAAPIISFILIFLVLSIGMGFSVAGTSLVSQYIGAKKEEKAYKVAGNLLTYLVLFSILFGALGVMLDKQLLGLLKTPGDTFELTRSYFRIMMMGMPFAFPIFVYQSVMNGYGDTVSPLKIELITAAINLVLDPILIFGWLGLPAMGVEGAALTTVITRGLASAIGLYYFFSGKKGIKLKLHHLKPDIKLFPLMFKIGIPATVGMTGMSLGFIVLMGFVNLFGTVVISAFGIVIRVLHLFMLPAMGISGAVTAIVGQNLGADNPKRAKEAVSKGIVLMLYVIVPAVIIIELFGEQVTGFFVPGDPLLHQIGRTMFHITTPTLIFYGLFTVLESAFRGAGSTIPSMVANLSFIWVFRIPFVYVACFVLMDGPGDIHASVGIWWGMLFSSVATFLLMLIWYLKGNWAKARIKESKIS
ncbi:MAG: MATE family efflux transporter [bacterium]|nr:MATE family efflux transporter [bacterium]